MRAESEAPVDIAEPGDADLDLDRDTARPRHQSASDRGQPDRHPVFGWAPVTAADERVDAAAANQPSVSPGLMELDRPPHPVGRLVVVDDNLTLHAECNGAPAPARTQPDQQQARAEFVAGCRVLAAWRRDVTDGERAHAV